ncbi:PREDICTED: nucleolar protein 56-like isoform X2 [Amphimedon queenslandica]|uniref:Nucleolar protein 56 n=3 Tax=Amphimedon queenslandica TaxID=400682 RepID=A0AAN0K561_AMPQE|nr:PREDICTED: nucleolar protein 56-like isoform X2 [Amphimedon queenslandica]|eukprot:XP_019864375.1 PREDICTED: nucleolar protein 56-like isoform X2 [Amphimedon queenslandica]
MVFFVLYEHATGYSLYRCSDVEDIGSLLPQIQEAVNDFAHFTQIVQLEAFSPFKNGANALDNINSISEGVVHDDLKAFLLNNLPHGKKKAKVILGVSDQKLSASIQDVLEVQCQHMGVVTEVMRGIRLYFHRLVKGLTAITASKAQLGLGHSYSRAKVKFNAHRSDNMIIQSISLLDQLDKDINTFSMRAREWYSYHFPELIRIVPDNITYAKVANFIGDRKTFGSKKLEELTELLQDTSKAEAIMEAARVSMGMDISPIDLINIQLFASRVIALSQYRKELSDYLATKMTNVAPNLTTLIGEQVGARLISHAGSLTNLAKCPASTVQILGAEKALFRALKTRSNTPKYGLIFHSSFIGRAGTKNKGRISRFLANKCSIASRIDCFTEFPTTLFGQKLKDQVEERLIFYDSGSIPRKNTVVMKEVITLLKEQRLLALPQGSSSTGTPGTEKKKKKKKRQREEEEEEVVKEIAEVEEDVTTSIKEKKKKKKRKREEEDEEDLTAAPPVDVESKKKKRKSHS